MSREELINELKQMNDKDLVVEYLNAKRQFLICASKEGSSYFKTESSMYSAKDKGNICEIILNDRGVKGIVTKTEKRDFFTDIMTDRETIVEWFDKDGNKIHESGDI